jgi:hypothetical protein
MTALDTTRIDDLRRENLAKPFSEDCDHIGDERPDR